MSSKKQIVGYLPDERPPFVELILFALQQIVVMFPATVLVAILTGFHVSTTIFASGLATLCFILVTGRKIPLYYGSSFSYIAAIASIMGSKQFANLDLNSKISIAQFGIVMSGLVSIAAGLIIKRFGRTAIEKVLPATVTGSIAIVIGLSLAGAALNNASSYSNPASVVVNAEDHPEGALNNVNLGAVISNANGEFTTDEVASATKYSDWSWVIALITLFSTVLYSIYLKGKLSQLPILFGLLTGYLAAAIIGMASGIDFINFNKTQLEGIFNLPIFTFPKASWAAVVAIMPIAIATIPESTAHIFQLDIYVNDFAKKKGSSKKYNLGDKLGLNLIGDGIGDIVSGAIGGPAGTNYGENISAMALSKVFSVPVLIVAAIITMVISCFTPLVNAVYSIPEGVIGGLSIYLFGVIAAQGITIMMDSKIDMFSSKNLAVIAIILIIGLGGSFAYPNGMITLFGGEFPAIASAAVVGILLNIILSIGDKKNTATDKE